MHLKSMHLLLLLLLNFHSFISDWFYGLSTI